MDEEELRPHCQSLRTRRERRRRARIGRAVPLREPVLHVIAEHVAHRVRDLARAFQRARMETVRKHLSPRAVYLVEAARHAHGEPLHAAGERNRILCLDQQMEMIPLDAEVDYAQAKPILSLLERFLQGAEAAASANARPTESDSHGHVRWRP